MPPYDENEYESDEDKERRAQGRQAMKQEFEEEKRESMQKGVEFFNSLQPALGDRLLEMSMDADRYPGLHGQLKADAGDSRTAANKDDYKSAFLFIIGQRCNRGKDPDAHHLLSQAEDVIKTLLTCQDFNLEKDAYAFMRICNMLFYRRLGNSDIRPFIDYVVQERNATTWQVANLLKRPYKQGVDATPITDTDYLKVFKCVEKALQKDGELPNVQETSEFLNKNSIFVDAMTQIMKKRPEALPVFAAILSGLAPEQGKTIQGEGKYTSRAVNPPSGMFGPHGITS